MEKKFKESKESEFFDTDFMIKLMYIMFTLLLTAILLQLAKLTSILEALSN